jgi:hypothetical protein
LIGRQLSKHSAKIPSWDALFTLTSQQLREAGVEPARARRYLLWWRERFRNGIVGIGGDAKSVRDGVAEVRVVEVPGRQGEAMLGQGEGMKRMVVNVPATVSLPKDPAKAEADGSVQEVQAAPPQIDVKDAPVMKGLKIVAGNRIGGTGLEPVKGHLGVARLKVKEGLWEERRGHKVDGGERRKAEVRYKRRAQERKNAR